MARLKQYYQEVLRSQLVENFGFSNVFQAPKLEKIVVNMGIGEAIRDSRYIGMAKEGLAMITGQQPIVTKARRSIAAFKLREGMDIGVKVTLRQKRMYEFLDRLITVAMPRMRDFRGVSPKGFDGRGNFTFGVREHLVFPEIKYDKVDTTLGMDISFVMQARTDQEAQSLLAGFGVPFIKN